MCQNNHQHVSKIVLLPKESQLSSFHPQNSALSSDWHSGPKPLGMVRFGSTCLSLRHAACCGDVAGNGGGKNSQPIDRNNKPARMKWLLGVSWVNLQSLNDHQRFIKLNLASVLKRSSHSLSWESSTVKPEAKPKWILDYLAQKWWTNRRLHYFQGSAESSFNRNAQWEGESPDVYSWTGDGLPIWISHQYVSQSYMKSVRDSNVPPRPDSAHENSNSQRVSDYPSGSSEKPGIDTTLSMTKKTRGSTDPASVLCWNGSRAVQTQSWEKQKTCWDT